MRRFIALVLFTSTFVLCSVASAYAEKLPPDTRIEFSVKAPAIMAEEVIFNRPETPNERLETFATVVDGVVILPEAHCNSPGF
jgi:hypothetical protein